MENDLYAAAETDRPETRPRLPLAMSFMPKQSLETLFDPIVALQNGTLFPELNKPWYGRCCHE